MDATQNIIFRGKRHWGTHRSMIYYQHIKVKSGQNYTVYFIGHAYVVNILEYGLWKEWAGEEVYLSCK